MADSQSGKSKRIRTESGALVHTSKLKPGEMYSKWKKRTHKDITLPSGVNTSTSMSSNESDPYSPSANAGAGKDYRKGHQGHSTVKNARNNFNNTKAGYGPHHKESHTNFKPDGVINFKANTHVKDELKSKTDIAKKFKLNKKNELKNMSKDKRKQVVGKMKQAASKKMSNKALLASQRGGNRRSKVYVR